MILDEFLKIRLDNYTQICSIKADLSHIVTPQSKVDGKYYHIDFDIILLFGLTELKAQLAWLEKVRIAPFSTQRHC